VWGAEFVGEPQVVYVHIRWLREKQGLIFEPFYRSAQRQRIK
jgi:DNA-binding response OmpR family regulator